MKIKLLSVFLLIIALSYSSCDDKDDPKLIPTVTVNSPTELTTTTAMASGGISSDGNASLTETGFVYSSNVAQPTTADNKTKSSSPAASFMAKLEGLSSGTTYHLRAYAINEVGTGYSDVIDFMTGNAAPTATELSIDGSVEVNKTITAKYKYNDAENNPEGASTFQWYAANDAAGNGETLIAGATAKTFTIQDSQNGKFLRFSITPKATAGTSAGADTKSPFSTAVGTETVTFNYKGTSVTYGTIISAATQKKWLDRNIGATRLAQSVDDYLAYGDLFQWGRAADGHQYVSRTGKADADATPASGTTTNKPASTPAPDDKFVIDSSFGSSGDWLATQNDNLWQGVNGVNNPCPTGWRLPTKDELLAENISSLTDGFSKLKLTFSGTRAVETGNVGNSANYGFYWSSTTTTNGSGFGVSNYAFISTSAALRIGNGIRGNGIPCRCIKN